MLVPAIATTPPTTTVSIFGAIGGACGYLNFISGLIPDIVECVTTIVTTDNEMSAQLPLTVKYMRDNIPNLKSILSNQAECLAFINNANSAATEEAQSQNLTSAEVQNYVLAICPSFKQYLQTK